MVNTITNKDIQFAKRLTKYAEKWVALQVKEKRIIASGETLREVQAKLDRKKERDYVFHLVEKYPLALGHFRPLQSALREV